MAAGLSLDVDTLCACLEAVPPLDLLGVRLLRQSQTTSGGWLPTDAPVSQVVEATLELVAYGDRASQAGEQLAGLQPIPLSVPVMEFSL